MSRRRDMPAASTREALIEAATRLFASQGFDGTTTRDIVEATGLNISLIAYHFGGKEGLLDACLETAARTVLGEAATELSTPPATAAELRARLKAYMERFLDLHVRHPHMQRLVIAEVDRDSDSFRRVIKSDYTGMFQTLYRFFRSAQDAGLVRPGLDPLTMALSLNGLLVQHLRLARIRTLTTGESLEDPAFRARLIEDTLTLFCQGIANP